MRNFSVQASQLRKWNPAFLSSYSEKIFLVVSTYEKGGIEWVDILMEGRTMTMTASTIRIDTEMIE